MRGPDEADDWVPGLHRHVRLRLDKQSGKQVLLGPERALFLNDSAGRILALCDGVRSVAAIVDCLSEQAPDLRRTVHEDVRIFLSDLKQRGFVREEATFPTRIRPDRTP